MTRRPASPQLQADRLHAQSVARTSDLSWLVWLGASVPVGCAAALLGLVRPAAWTDSPGLLAATYAAATVATTLVTGAFVALTARSTLAGRGARSDLTWLAAPDVRMTAASTSLLIAAAFAVSAAAGVAHEPRTVVALQVVFGFVAVYRALSLAYSRHYLEAVLRPSAAALYVAESAGGSVARRAARRVLRLVAVPPRHLMVLPALQTALVTYALPQLWSVALLAAEVSPTGGELAYTAPTLTLLTLSSWLWGRWHLYGGAGRLLRVGGRPMRPDPIGAAPVSRG